MTNMRFGRALPLPSLHRIGHSEPVKRLAPLLLLAPGLMLAGRAYAAPEPRLYDALGRPIALPGVRVSTPGAAGPAGRVQG